MSTIYSPATATDPRPDIPTVIQIGKVSQVLAMVDSYKNRDLRGDSKAPDNRLWLLLCAVTEILDWFNYYLPDHEWTPVIANYLWALISPYQFAALRALNVGGIVINPSTGTPMALQRYREDFEIGGGDLPEAKYGLNDGDTEYIVPLSGFVIAFFEPSGVDEFIGDSTQASLVSIDYQPTYVRFVLNQPVRTGEKYIVWGLRGGNITSVTNTSPNFPLPYKKGQFLTNDGTNLKWDDVWITITSADFEPDGKTYINTSLDGYYLGVIWENVGETWLNFESDPPEATLIDGGGFIVNLDGFDAKANPDWKFKVFKKSLPE